MTSAAEITIVCLVAVGIAVICVLAARAIWVGGPPRSFRAHTDTALGLVAEPDEAAWFEAPDPGEARWLRLIDPESGDYNALAEFANNLHPDLRRPL